MRTNQIIALLLLATFVSCKKDTIEQAETEKAPTACINGPAEVETASGATYAWCGENASEVQWSLNGGPFTSGNTFSPAFTAKGKQTIIARGSNSAGATEASFETFYGRSSKIACAIRSVYALRGNKRNYRAYLYNTKSEWASDAAQGVHVKAIDSVSCRDSSLLDGTVLYAFFKSTYTAGSRKMISVEYRDAQKPGLLESNWNAAFNSPAQGNVLIQNQDLKNDTCGTVIDTDSKWILSTRWYLTQVDTGAGLATVTDCLADDYMLFFADGSWSYFTGDNVCDPGAAPAHGTFNFIPFLTQSAVSPLQTLQGSFLGRNPYGWEINSSLESKVFVAPSGYYVFTANR